MNKKPITHLLGWLLTAFVTIQVSAQEPARHELIRGDLPPGETAWLYQQAEPSLVGHMQPVQLVAPADTTIEVGDAANSFGQAQPIKMTVAMAIGYVYRFKLSNLPQPDAAGQTLYPSIEVIGKLSPPPGLENDFPIQVVVTRDDIDLALGGRMVTRVIYLEDPRGTLPHLHTEADQPSVDVRRGQDPLRAAEQMGRPMAILRMGSRVPMPNEVAEWFTFGVAGPQVLPDPRPANLAGLNDRELEIVRAMKQAETQAAEAEARAAEAEARARRQAKAEAEAAENEQVEQVNRADSEANNSGDLAQTLEQPEAGIQAVPANTPLGLVKSTSGEPKWMPVKANTETIPQVERSKIKNMPPTRMPHYSKESNARSPAPSMALMYFEPLKVEPKEDQPDDQPDDQPENQTQVQPQPRPLLAPLKLRRPNEL